MGASADSLMCAPGDCINSNIESEDNGLRTFRYSTDAMTPSAIHAGSAWEHAANIPEEISQDIKLTVSLFNTDIDLSWCAKSGVSMDFKVMKAKQLLHELREGKYIDQRIQEKPDKLSGAKRQHQYSIRNLINNNFVNKAQSKDSIKSSSLDSAPEKYELNLPPWSDTWRLKCAFAQLSGIPARDQFLVCSNMTAQSSVELNHPATSLSDLPVYSEQPKKPKSKHFPRMLSFNISGGKTSNANSSSTSSCVPQSPHLDLIIIASRSSRSELYLEQGPSIDSSDKSSKMGSFYAISELSDGGQPEFQNLSTQSIIEMNNIGDSSDPISLGEQYGEQENSQKRNCVDIPKKNSYGTLPILSPIESAADSIEDFALEDWSDDERKPCAQREKERMHQGELVFLKMKMNTGKADLIQVMVGLTRLGCERPKLGQARILFESVGCRITDCITPDHIRLFLQSPQEGEDIWLSNLRELMASVVDDPVFAK